MIQRPDILPNISSRFIDFKSRMSGVGRGIVDDDNQVRLEWVNPSTIGQQIDRLITQTEHSQHGTFVPPELADKLDLDMRALRRAKNTVSAIQVFGVFADVSEMDRLSAAHVVTSMIIEPGKDEQFADTVIHLAAILGHRQSKKSLMTAHRVNIGQ